MKIDSHSYNYQPSRISLWFLQALIALLFIILCARFWYLQILKGEEFLVRAEANTVRTEKIFTPRGRIYDAEGKILAGNSLVFNLVLVKEDCPDVEVTLTKISELLDISLEELKYNYNAPGHVAAFIPIPIIEDMSFEQMAKLEAQSFFLPGVSIQTQARRYYPDGNAFAHILGYVSKANYQELEKNPDLVLGDNIGKQGLELTLEENLRGDKGEYKNSRNAIGRIIAKDLQVPPHPGDDITLSLNKDLQMKIIELMGNYSGSVIVMDPTNGQLLAMVTLPTYDNNLFVRGLSIDEWHDLSTNPRSPLHNRSTQAMYPPGSVWKILMASLFLENDVDPEEEIECTGNVVIGNDKFHCWREHGHGKVNLEQALVESCDVYFYLQGEKMGIDKISEYAFKSGFGHTTGIDLPNEKGGLVPSREWKRERYNTRWLGGETINVSIGQGQTLVTALQMATYTSAVKNGGKLLKPQLIANSEPEITAELPISPENLKFIQDVMVSTVNTPKGTARTLAYTNLGITIGGKTGTAQVVSLRRNEEDERLSTEEMEHFERDHSWITSFASYNNKDIVVTTMVEHGGGGSSTAGPITRQIINYYYNNN